jgi:hypothetical protein
MIEKPGYLIGAARARFSAAIKGLNNKTLKARIIFGQFYRFRGTIRRRSQCKLCRSRPSFRRVLPKDYASWEGP